MKKLISALFLSAVIFGVLNFIYCNLNEQAFNYPMSFRFTIPYALDYHSPVIPLGFVVITAFCLGILFLALLQALPFLVKTIAVRSRDRRIKELEKQLEGVKLGNISEKKSGPANYFTSSHNTGPGTVSNIDNSNTP